MLACWQAGGRVLIVLVAVPHVARGYVHPSPLPICVAGALCWQPCRTSPLEQALLVSWQAGDGVLIVPIAVALVFSCVILGLVCGMLPIGQGLVNPAGQ